MNAYRCNGVNASGERCSSFANASGFCIAHDPQRAAEASEARRRGGLGRSTAAQARKELLKAGDISPQEVLAILGLAMRRVMGGRLPPATAAALGTLSRAWFAGQGALAAEEIKARLAALEARQRELKPYE